MEAVANLFQKVIMYLPTESHSEDYTYLVIPIYVSTRPRLGSF